MKTGKTVLAVLSFVALVAGSAGAYTLSGFYHKSHSALFHAVPYNEGDASALQSYADLMVDGLSVWNDLADFTYLYQADASDPCDFDNGIFGWKFSDTNCGDEWGSGTMAVSRTRYYESGPVFDTGIIINDDFDYSLPANSEKFLTTISHELGHSLGLGHSSDPASLMYYQFHKVTTPQEDDINGLVELYGAGNN
jgi:hypothetical protein